MHYCTSMECQLSQIHLKLNVCVIGNAHDANTYWPLISADEMYIILYNIHEFQTPYFILVREWTVLYYRVWARDSYSNRLTRAREMVFIFRLCSSKERRKLISSDWLSWTNEIRAAAATETNWVLHVRAIARAYHIIIYSVSRQTDRQTDRLCTGTMATEIMNHRNPFCGFRSLVWI